MFGTFQFQPKNPKTKVISFAILIGCREITYGCIRVILSIGLSTFRSKSRWHDNKLYVLWYSAASQFSSVVNASEVVALPMTEYLNIFTNCQHWVLTNIPVWLLNGASNKWCVVLNSAWTLKLFSQGCHFVWSVYLLILQYCI